LQFRRIDQLPPYAFAEVDRIKLELRRAGEDVIDLGFGNPDVASPDIAVAKLQEAAGKPRNHRYSASRGIPRLRAAICDLYRRKFGVELDPETQAITTIGAKEGLAHLMWVLAGPGDTVVVPTPTYPIHRYAPILTGARVADFDVTADDPIGAIREAVEREQPRVLVLSYPHNPTTVDVEPGFFDDVVALARERELLVVHDFAYADLAFDGYEPPSILQVEGATDCCVELYTLTKSFSMAGWRVGFMLGNPDAVAALGRLKSYLDYGTFQPIQIAATVVMNEAPEYPSEVAELYRSRRDSLCNGLNRVGWAVPPPRGTMFVWAELPEPYRGMPSMEFALKLAREAKVAVSPGSGFGPGGDGHVRFALVENEQRILQAIRSIRRALPELRAAAV
jgi:alanine-synthesizing transaminase